MASRTEDPVEAKSTFLTAYMSSHQDTLVAYVLHEFQKSKSKQDNLRAQDVRDPKMLKITSKSFILQYTDKASAVKTVEVDFDPPLAGYEEVRPRLLQMKAEAESSIGMAKKPIITKYEFPFNRNTIIVLCMLGLYIGCATQQDGRGTFSRIRNLFGGWAVIKATGAFIIIAHSAEAAFQFRSCQRFSVPLPTALLWTLTTFILGFASLLKFRQVVREARIASVDKLK